MLDAEEQAVLDAIEDEAEELRHSKTADQSARLFEQRAAELTEGEPGRAAWLSQAGESWELADDLEQARRCYEAASADGGAAWIDVRAPLAGVLLDLGEVSRAEALIEELRRDLTKATLRGPVHEFVGEQLELHDRPDEALRWFTAGLRAAERDGADEDLPGCLNGRFRVRRVLGLPKDRYDEIVEQSRQRLGHDFDTMPDWSDGTADDAEPPPARAPRRLAVLYWPPDEFGRLVSRWPAMADDYGEQHADHRALLERRLRDHAAVGVSVVVAAGLVEEYVEYAAADGHDPATGATRAGYAAHLGFLGRTSPWPPGRNESCWCGSGAKYKKCCGGLRFPIEESD